MPGSIDNPFTHAAAAARYAQSRPNVHPDIIRTAARHLSPVKLALDVACGTGRSSAALRRVAERVVGVDPSHGMLSEATAGFSRVRGRAEALPFGSQAFGLVSVGLAFHWLERDAFLREARRVLGRAGVLLVYNSWFSGHVTFAAGFHAWWKGEYLVRYPSPARHAQRPSDEEARGAGFEPAAAFAFQIAVTMTPARLVDYLTTQSNVIAAVEGGTESLDLARERLLGSVRPLFERDEGNVLFENAGWVYVKR